MRLHWRKPTFPLWVLGVRDPGLRMWAGVYFPSQCWYPSCLDPVHAASPCGVIWASDLLCLEDCVSLVSCILTCSCNLPACLFHRVPWVLREGIGWRYPMCITESSKASLILCILSRFGAQYFFLIFSCSSRRKLLGGGWTRYWSVSMVKCHWESFYC